MVLMVGMVLVLPAPVLAAGSTLSGFFEAGKRSTAEDYEEEDTDDDYRYEKYHLKFMHDLGKRLNYELSSYIYEKDYKAKDELDNRSWELKNKWLYYLLKEKEEDLRLVLKLKYKEKRYDNTPTSEYDRIGGSSKLTYKKKDRWSMALSGGLDNYDYLEASEKDHLKIFGKLEGKRYSMEKRLMLTSSYRCETLDEKVVDRKRTKDELMGGFDYIFDRPWIYKVTARGNWGERDTKEEDERDEDYDYDYRRYYAKTEHRISPKIKTHLKYQYFKKDYLTADLDHSGYYLKNGWRYEILDDKRQKLYLDLDAEHKDLDYTIRVGNDYKRETVALIATYQRKKKWKLQASCQGNFYDYDDASNDKNRYYAKLSCEKLFLDGDLSLSVDFKYRYTDYDQKDDTEHEAVRVTFEHKF